MVIINVTQVMINQSFSQSSDRSQPLNALQASPHVQIQGSLKAKTYQNTARLTLVIIVLCFSSFYFGYCLVYFSTFSLATSSQILGEQSTENTVRSFLFGVIPLGAIPGAGMAPFLMKCFTRKHLLLITNAFALAIEGVIQVTNLWVFMACRICQGMCVGIYMAMVPIYIYQICPKQVLGSYGVFTQLFVIVALVFVFGMGLAFDAADLAAEDFFHIMVSMIGFFTIVQSLLLIVNFIPQSPNSLLLKGRREDAKEVVALFTVQPYVEETIEQKQKQVDIEQKRTSEGDSTQIQYSWIAYLLAFVLPLMQQMNGINALVTQAEDIVKTVIPDIAHIVPIIIQSIQLISTLSTVLILRKFGRKPLILIGNIGLAIIDLTIGILFTFRSWSPSGYFIFALLILFNITYGVTLGPVVWLYVPQIIPAKVVPFATMLNWTGATICVLLTPIVIKINHGNPDVVFYFFGGISHQYFSSSMLPSLWRPKENQPNKLLLSSSDRNQHDSCKLNDQQLASDSI